MKKLLTLLLLMVSPCWAAGPYYTDYANGSDANDGLSEGNAWKTIGKAMGTVTTNTTVYVQGGTSYADQDDATGAIGSITTVGVEGGPIIFEGYTTSPGDGTFADATLDATSNSLTNCITDNAIGSVNTFYKFKYLRFTGASGAGLDCNAADSTGVYDCRSDNNGDVGFLLDKNSIVYGCQADTNGNDGIQCDTSGTNTISCVSFGNTGQQIQGGLVVYNCLVYAGSAPYITSFSYIIGCTIDGENAYDGISLPNTSNLMAINNIIYDCAEGIQCAASYTFQLSKHNHFDSNTTDTVNWPSDSTDVSGAPLFTNEAGDDYTLQSGSPAKAAGTDAGTVVGTSYIDIGAHQRAEAGGSTVVVIMED